MSDAATPDPDTGPIGGTPALLVIDPQRDFLDPDGAAAPAATSAGGPAAVVENVRRLVAAARTAALPVVWSREIHRPDGADAGLERLGGGLDHAVAGSRGAAFVDGLDADPDDLPPAEYLVTKRRYDLFFRTELAHLLDSYGVDTVLLCGATTGLCVGYTAHGAFQRDYAYRVIEDCVAAPSRERHEAGLTLARTLLPDGSGVRSLAAVRDALDGYDGNPVVERVRATGSVEV